MNNEQNNNGMNNSNTNSNVVPNTNAFRQPQNNTNESTQMNNTTSNNQMNTNTFGQSQNNTQESTQVNNTTLNDQMNTNRFGQPQNNTQESTPMNNTIINNQMPYSQPQNNNNKKSIVPVIIIAILIIAILGFIGYFVGSQILNKDNSTNNVQTTTTSIATTTSSNGGSQVSNDQDTITYAGKSLIIPSGYTAQEQNNMIYFTNDNKLFTVGLVNYSYSDIVNMYNSQYEMQPTTKNLNGITFILYDTIEESKHVLIYVLPTSVENLSIIGFAINKSFTYDESVLSDVSISLGLTENQKEFNIPTNFANETPNYATIDKSIINDSLQN